MIVKNKINIEIRRSTTPGKRVILVQGPCESSLYRSNFFVCHPEGDIILRRRSLTSMNVLHSVQAAGILGAKLFIIIYNLKPQTSSNSALSHLWSR